MTTAVPPTEADERRSRLLAELATLRARFPERSMAYVYLLMGVSILDSADRSSLTVVFDDIKDEFLVSDAQLGMLTAAYSIIAAVSVVPFGILADRWRRVWLIAFGFVPWSIAMFWSGAATSFAMLFVARMLLASIEATNGPATPSLIGDYYRVERRTRIFGWILLASLFGNVLGIAVTGVMASTFGWRAPFFVWGVLGLTAAVVVLRFLPEPERGMPDAIHRVEAALAELDDGDGGGSEATPVVPTRPARPVPDDYRALTSIGTLPYLLRIPTMWIAFAASTVGLFTLTGVSTWGISFLRRYHELSAAGAAGIIALVGITAMAGIFVGARVGERLEPLQRIAMAAVTTAGAGAAFVLTYGSDSLVVVAVSAMIGGFLLLFAEAPMMAIALDVVVPHLRGRAAALRSLLRIAAIAGAPLIVGVLSDRYGLRTALVGVMPFLFVNGFIVWFARRTYVTDRDHCQAESLRQIRLEATEVESRRPSAS